MQSGINIVLRALEAPIRQIAENSGVEGSIVVGKVLSQQIADLRLQPLDEAKPDRPASVDASSAAPNNALIEEKELGRAAQGIEGYMSNHDIHHLHVNGYDMAYTEHGSGEPVVLVHGSLGDSRYWMPQMDALGRFYRVIAVSLRHYWPERWDGKGGRFTIRQHVEDVVAFVSALDAGQVRLIGHSRGAHVAFRVAEAHGGLLRAVVLAEPGGELDESLGGQPSTGAPSPALARAAQLVRDGEVEDALRGFAANTGGPGAWERRPEPRRQIARHNARTLLGQINEQRAPFSLAAAQAIRTPTLLVGGAETQPQFVAIMNALEFAIPGAKRVTIPGAKHQMSFDNPAAFNAAVLEFLAAA